MKRTIALLAFAVLFASILGAGPFFRNANAGLGRNVQAKETNGCTVATLDGDYLWTGTAQANFDQRDDPTYPRVFVGVVTFDGAGNLTVFGTNSLGGQINRRITATGTYTLNSDCTGTVHLGEAANSDLFVSKDGSEGNWIRYDDGTIATRSFKRR